MTGSLLDFHVLCTRLWSWGSQLEGKVSAVSAMWGLVVFFTQKACQNNVLNKIVSFFFFNELKVTIEAPYMYFSLIFIGEILWLLVLRLLSPI